jgi:hypothetical protein
LSVRETAMVEAYWRRVGGTLIEEYPLTKQLLCERLGAASVHSVALCELGDAVLGPLYEQYDDCEVVVLASDEYEHPGERSSTE